MLGKRKLLTGLIIGAGDVARRLTTAIGIGKRVRWMGLARSVATANALRDNGILPVIGDLDFRRSLKRAGALARGAHAVLHLAPPQGDGVDDLRMKRWLAASATTNKLGRHSSAQMSATRIKMRAAIRPTTHCAMSM